MLWGGHDIKIIKAGNYSAYHVGTHSALFSEFSYKFHVALYYSPHVADEKN